MSIVLSKNPQQKNKLFKINSQKKQSKKPSAKLNLSQLQEVFRLFS